MEEDDNFERLKQQVVTELEAMEANAEVDALAMLGRIHEPDDNPEAAAYQMLLLNQELKERINFYSLMAIIEIVERNTASARALIRHAPSNSAKTFVREEWAKHRHEYDGNKSEFARIYVRRVFNEHGVKVTEKQMREVWLKDTPSASNQAGMRADG